jgi:sugar lactone lactonase YvrE
MAALPQVKGSWPTQGAGDQPEDSMRTFSRGLCIALMILAGWAAPPRPAQAADQDTTADRVFGQADFFHNSTNAGGLGPASLQFPAWMALDTRGNLYVADTYNNRVLEYDAPLTTQQAAHRVFGQPDFIHNGANTGGVNANSLNKPAGVALDAQGNLIVADGSNNRVLEYDAPLTSDATADRVFGQPDFTHNAMNTGGLSASTLYNPYGVALDTQGNLFVADEGNNRVLAYKAALTNSRTADVVYGQADFNHNSANSGGLSASSLWAPSGVALDAQGNLFVADIFNNRVLEFDSPLGSDTTADRVIGQPDFTHNTANNGGIHANSLAAPGGLAVDAAGDLYVDDSSNSRVLEYNAPLTTHAAADRVFGQPDFTHNAINHGGLSANSLNGPFSVALEAQGNLYVADYQNSRVLEYDVPVPHAGPALAALSPSRVPAGSPAFTLTVDGAGFYSDSVVRLNGGDRPTTFLNSTQLQAALSAADVTTVAPFAITVHTPTPGGGDSTLVNLRTYTRAGQDATADLVQGQPNFVSNVVNNALMPSASQLGSPLGAAVDRRSGRLFVADASNNRVLSWPNAASLANSQAADLVLGQPDFFSRVANYGGVSARSLDQPIGLALDAQGDLYVADYSNNRVLEYATPLTTHMAASRVFGQGGSFNTAAANNGGISANSLNQPVGVALDAHGNLYVADRSNNRVLEYDSPLTAGATADRVFGQSAFNHNSANYNGITASGLNEPYGVALGAQGHLYVADFNNNRVLEYPAPLTTQAAAIRVFGQPDFTHIAGGLSADSLFGPAGVTLDGQNNLYVADSGDYRALEYDWALGRVYLPLLAH